MDLFDINGIGAATVVVDIDQMTEELRRLRRKGDDVNGSEESRDEARPGLRPLPGPVHRPSWNGRLDAEPQPHSEGGPEQTARFMCGR